MREQNWAQRQPGSASGSVVPPPAAEIAPALPKRVRNKSGLQAARPRPDPPEPPVQLGTESLLPPANPVLASSASGQIPEQNDVDEAPQEGLPGSAGPAGSTSPAADLAVAEPAPAPPPATGPVAALRLRRRPGGRAASRRRLAWVAALTAILIAAGGTAVALSRQHVGGPPGDPAGTRLPGTTGTATNGLSEAGAARVHAAAWISREISRSAIIACDAVMCSSLFNDGLPASNLLVLSPTAPDPLGADVVAATPAVRNQFGRRLAAVYAPTVLASFGSGQTRVDIRVVAPDGSAIYQRALRADVAARKVFGDQLLRNKQVALPPGAVVQLAAGWIDARLLLTLPVLAAKHPIKILAFGDQAPGAGWGVPLTSVVLSGSGRAANLTDHAYVSWMLGFLRDQRPPFRAANIATARRGHQIVITVRFAKPSPLGLLGQG